MSVKRVLSPFPHLQFLIFAAASLLLSMFPGQCRLWAAPQTDPPSLEQSKKLLDALLLDDPAGNQAPDARPGNASRGESNSSRNSLRQDDKMLLDTSPESDSPETDVGEDVGTEEIPDPLHDIGERMLQAADWIFRRELLERTLTLQGNILSDLDSLIDQAKQRKRQRAPGSAQPNPVAPRDAISQPPAPSTAGPPQVHPRPQESNERSATRETRDVVVDMAEMESLIKEIWGQLPPRAREQLLNSHVERFLPQYEQIISAYFKRLAEEEMEGKDSH